MTFKLSKDQAIFGIKFIAKVGRNFCIGINWTQKHRKIFVLKNKNGITLELKAKSAPVWESEEEKIPIVCCRAFARF